MERTALNVGGSITAGTSRMQVQTDMAVFNSAAELAVDGKNTAP